MRVRVPVSGGRVRVTVVAKRWVVMVEEEGEDGEEEEREKAWRGRGWWKRRRRRRRQRERAEEGCICSDVSLLRTIIQSALFLLAPAS